MPILSGWGACPELLPGVVLDGGQVDLDDLLLLLGAWGIRPDGDPADPQVP